MAGRQSPRNPYETKIGDGGAAVAVELEADLNADPTGEFVTKGQWKGIGHEWTCNCCGANLTGHKRKLTVHIAGKKFLNDRNMDVRTCTPAAMIKLGDH